MIYFDHNATSPIDPRVLEAMQPYLTTFYGNPSSTHRLGRASRTAIDTAREQVAKLIGAESAELVFTSGGTEANNLALIGVLNDNKQHVLYAATEHPSVKDPLTSIASKGFDVGLLTVNTSGQVCAKELLAQVKPNTRLISVMHANNETGVLQNIASLTQALQGSNSDAIFHTDAVQSAGKVPIQFTQMGAQLMTLSSHKLYGPKGVGALIFDKSVPLQAIQRGGGQELGLRPGTENLAAIVGFGKAAELALQELSQRTAFLLSLKERLERQLLAIKGISIVAESVDRLVNTTQIVVDGMDGEMMLMQMDRQGICISGGSACASRVVAPSPVLTAMGYDKEQALSAIRISLGMQNTEAEVDQFCHALADIIASYRL